MPGGAIVDWARRERLVAGVALTMITVAALAYACFPIFPVVFSAAVLHAAASCVLGPCIVALSLGLVGYGAIGDRLGRNARFASIGNGTAAAAMGAIGYFFSAQAVFFVTAALLIPTLFALSRIQPREVDPELAHGSVSRRGRKRRAATCAACCASGRCSSCAVCAAIFHLANASMLPLMASVVTTRSGEWATVLIAACIVVPQIVVALISPWVGHQAQIWGRRWFLLTAFAALAVRGLLFSTVTNPQLLVAVQLLDGITAATLGVMVPLMIADIARGTGHFNLAQGIIGTAVGIGASISPTLSGYLSDQFGSPVAFLGLSAIAAIGLARVWMLMPETRPADDAVDRAARPMRSNLMRRQRRARGIRLGDDTQPRRGRAHQLAIDREIIERHALRREVLLEVPADSGARQMRQAIDRADRAGFVLDDEAGDAVGDHLRHRAAIERDHRRAARHRLDHHQAERLRPVDRHQQRDRAAEECRLLVIVDLADVIHIRAVHHRLDLLVVIVAVGAVDLGGDLQASRRNARAMRMAISTRFSGAMRPRNAK